MSNIRPWYPLESPPEVFTSMARKWGLPEHISFYDVWGLDDEMLDLIPTPVHAIILLFPDTPEIVKYRKEDNNCMDASTGKEPLWMPQTVLVGHSCGTFAMIHALASTKLCPLLSPFFDSCRPVPPEERTKLFAECDLIRLTHNEAVTKGQTLLRDTDWEECDHFLSFIQVKAGEEKRLVEMDGNAPRTGPMDRGVSGDLLRDVARAVKEEYIPRAGENVHFSMMALAG